MPPIAITENKEIKSICTRFVYEQGALKYQIEVNYLNGNLMYKTFEQYEEYQSKHNDLVEAVNKGSELIDEYLQKTGFGRVKVPV